MKKVPVWIRKVIAFSNRFPCADTREELMAQLESGNFDYASFESLCKNSHLAFDKNGIQDTDGGNGYGAFDNKWDAVEAAGENGTIKSMQGVLHDIFNNQ